MDKKTVTLVVGIVTFILTVIAWTFFPDHQLFAAIFAAATVLAFSAWFALFVIDKKKTNTLRGVKYGANAVATVIITILCLVAINYVASRHEKKVDLTKNQSNSLSEQTVKILQGLSKTIHIISFVNPQYDQQVKDLVGKFKYHAKEKLEAEYVDPNKQPWRAKEYGVTQSRPDVIVIQTDETKHNIESLNPNNLEEQIINGIIQVTKGGKKKVYFLTGHGEHALADKEQGGLSSMKESLEKASYEVKDFSLLEKSAVPEDANIVVIAGPTKPPFDSEVKALSAYLDRPGNILFLADPETPQDWNQVLQPYGLKFSNRVVVENNPLAQMAGGSPLAPAVKDYNTTTDIGKNFGIPSIFVLTADIIMQKDDLPAGVDVKWLAKTGGNSWAEADLRQGSQSVSFDAGRDIKGPVIVAATSIKSSGTATPADPHADPHAEKTPEEKKTDTKETRLLLFGDSDFSSNQYSRFAGNADMFLNSVAWLGKDADLISVRPKPQDESKLEISSGHARMITVTTLLLLPLGFFVLSYTIYRRKLAL